MEVHNTHEIFFKKITHKKMNEFLNRISTKYLENQINKELKDYTSEIELSNCKDVYITFFNSNQLEVGHITFHLNKDNKSLKNNSRRKGRLHIVNKNKQKYHTLRVNYNNTNDIMTLRVNSPLKMNSELEYCINIVLPIINSYLSTTHPFSLKERLTYMKEKDNKCIEAIAGVKYRSRFNKTRNKKPTSFSIPIQSSFSWSK
jgi:hypothetical protein